MPNTSPRSANTPSSVDTARRGSLATPVEVAAYLGVPVKTLYQWKYRGIGPNVHKVGRHLRYRWPEVDAWVNAQSAYDLTA
ncbi:helix-turn-helix transcriptional regulator [Streptomyces misionensis]|uniref:helix-turn-helix transcriptional regulator n=1 Tax=Streptomyces misionensis TaxID=67331 RepID=UPI0033FC13C0